MNSGGIIVEENIMQNSVKLTLRQGKIFKAYSRKKPSYSVINGTKCNFEYKDHIFTIELPECGIIKLEVVF
jgi:hypothetical protein